MRFLTRPWFLISLDFQLSLHAVPRCICRSVVVPARHPPRTACRQPLRLLFPSHTRLFAARLVKHHAPTESWQHLLELVEAYFRDLYR